eukprot:TCONS_00022117-protein
MAYPRRPYEKVTVGQENQRPNNPSPFSSGLHRIDSFEDIKWFHGELDRTAAESLLLQTNIIESTYLLRKSPRHDGYSVSVKCQGKVIKHFVLSYDNRIHEYKFGNASFGSLQDLLGHFESCPILTKENDVPVTLIHPYCKGEEPETYDTVDGHAEAGRGTFEVKERQSTAVASKGGYLTKRGGVVKSWKKRWFKSERNTLSYYENSETEKPIRKLDLTEAIDVGEDRIDDKDCFKLRFPQRTFYLVAESPSDTKEWIDHFKWKMDYYKNQET